MPANNITVTFPDRILADAAISRLRLYGALCQSCTMPMGGAAGSTTVHLTVREQDMPAVRQILHSEGGQLIY
ncbi:MAG: hypothetical protein SPE74_03590 [Oscillospiraceae bacterium]|nr:hypothetical protein [bacterium]MDY5100475.1 hypothetical protein [Oscillospiraceae bacterium]